CDLSKVGASGVIAKGDPNASIDLTNNYWGTTNSSQIDGYILDHADDATRPTVLFSPPLTLRPAHTASRAAHVPFSASVQSVSLTATVASPAGVVSEGTETFTILNGSTPVGNAVTVNVTSGAASATYSLPAGTPVGAYTISAVYSGTSNYSGDSDTSQLLTVG